MRQVEVRRVSLGELIHCCQEEERRFSAGQQHRPEFCHELFRRAIVENNQLAWSALYYQYEPLVSHWLRRQSGFGQLNEPLDVLVNEAYMRFFKALYPIADKDFCGRFPNTAAVLSFLSRCAATTVLDAVRTSRRRREDKTAALPEILPAPQRTERECALNDWQRRFLAQIKLHLKTDQEEVVFTESYLLEAKAAAILAGHPDLFANVQEIYNCRLRILRRLREDEQLAQFLD